MARSKSMELDGDNVELSPNTSRPIEHDDDTHDLAREENADTTDESFDLHDNFTLDDETEYVESADDDAIELGTDLTDDPPEAPEEVPLEDVQEDVLSSGSSDADALTDNGDLLPESNNIEAAEQTDGMTEMSDFMGSLSDTGSETLDDILSESGLLESSVDTDAGDVRETSYEDAGNDIDEDSNTGNADTMDPTDLADNMEYQNDAQDAAENTGLDNVGDNQSDADYFENEGLSTGMPDGTEQVLDNSAYSDGFDADIEDLSLTEAEETIDRAQQDDTAMPDVTDMQVSADNGAEMTDATGDMATTADTSADYLGDDPVLSDAAAETAPDMLSPDDLTSTEVFSPEVEVFDADTAPSTELDDLQKDSDDIDEPIMDMLDSYMNDDSTATSEPDSINDLLEDYINNDLMNDSGIDDIATPDIDVAREDANLPEVDALTAAGETDIASADNMNFADANDMTPDDLSIADTLDNYFDDVAADMGGLTDVDTMTGLDDTLMDNNQADTTMDNFNDFEADYNSFDDTSYDSMAD